MPYRPLIPDPNESEEFKKMLEEDNAARKLAIETHPPDCVEDECLTCGERDCKYGEPLHYHHDGCPACYFAGEWTVGA